MAVVCIELNDEILFSLDSYVVKMKHDKPKQHYSRKKVMEEALDYFFRVHCGIPYMLKK